MLCVKYGPGLCQPLSMLWRWRPVAEIFHGFETYEFEVVIGMVDDVEVERVEGVGNG